MRNKVIQPTPQNPNPEIRMWKGNSEVSVINTGKTYNLAIDFALNDLFEEVEAMNPLEIHQVLNELKNASVKYMLGKVHTTTMKEFYTVISGAERFFKELFESEVKNGR